MTMSGMLAVVLLLVAIIAVAVVGVLVILVRLLGKSSRPPPAELPVARPPVLPAPRFAPRSSEAVAARN